MDGAPPPFAQYPRNAPAYGGASQLRALMEGYYGLSIVFAVNVLLVILWRVTSFFLADLALLLVPVVGLAIGFLAYPYNKKIGYGAGWAPSQAIIASVLMGINSALCCGIVGFVVMQTIAMNHIKKYGIKGGFFGLKKRDIEAKITELSASGV